MSAPVSYATEAAARMYVTRVLGGRRQLPKRPGRVYVIAPPSLPGSQAWRPIRRRLKSLMPGAELLTYSELFAEPPRKRVRARPIGERLERITAECLGAVVIPRKVRDAEGAPPRHLLGYAARLEALGVLKAGLPVLVFVPGGLVAWPDVRVHAAEPGTSAEWYPLELDVPEAPPDGVVLPTVAASYRALGLPKPHPWIPPPAEAEAAEGDQGAAPDGDAAA